MQKPLHVVILAAGQGTRMKSELPKVIHAIGGKPMVAHVVDVAQSLDAKTIQVVYGHGGDLVRQTLSNRPVSWVEQAEQLGTGHAVQQAVPALPANENVLVLYGDVPLISAGTLQKLIEQMQDTALSLLTVELLNPTGYGRIVRDKNGMVQAIVEEKDATNEQRQITEINTGMMAANTDYLCRWLDQLSNKNSQGEYYLTDIIAMAVNEGITVGTVAPSSTVEVEGVNTKVQLARIERAYQAQQAEALMLAGVCLIDPTRFDCRGSLSAGSDVIIDVNVIIEGDVVLGNNVRIGANTVIRSSTIADDVEIKENCVIEQSTIEAACVIGPFARLRPETVLAEKVKIGNFVEIKKAIIAAGSKVNHLSYIGDTRMGKNVNVGAGTITCNYDGANKYETIVGDNVFIGSTSQLVAPVSIGEGATIGAGSTITHDVPAGELSLSRAPQKTRSGWKRPSKTNK
ncbi:MAG: bifunctional UDP-N-acetylglucosamine diphosphorylase/glucosamine-1-phosphate N-acetyltransferase GlmU [Thiohalomonadales bacterium]